METSYWIPSPSLKDKLFHEPYLFEFCQAVRILETLSPQCQGLGTYSNPLKEAVTFKSRVAYAYPPSDIYGLQGSLNNPPYVMEVNFMGIAGAEGPLPMPYTETIIQRAQAKDFAFQEFLNIFNHRLLSLFYRIRKKYAVSLENVPPENSRVGHLLLSFLGLGTPGYRNRLQLSDRSLLAYGGLVWGNTKSASSLIALLQDYFQVPFRLKPFHGEWMSLPDDQLTYLSTSNPWRTLGRGACLGTKAWTITRICTLRIGPLTYDQFRNFLPSFSSYTPLKSLTHFFRGLNHHVKLNLILKAKEIPPLTLTGGQALGWSTWLGPGPFLTDDSQVLLS